MPCRPRTRCGCRGVRFQCPRAAPGPSGPRRRWSPRSYRTACVWAGTARPDPAKVDTPGRLTHARRASAVGTQARSPGAGGRPPMKLGINLYLWADHMHDGLLPVLESLKRIGYDGVEVPIFDLDEADWARWGQRLDDLGLERTANTVIAAEGNPLSPAPQDRQAAYQHLRAVIDCCAAVGSSLL